MREFQFHKISTSLNHLLTNSVSALYYNAIKDRLYCDPLDSSARKSVQFTLYHVFETVTQAVAPMLPHLVEELYLYYPLRESKTYFTTAHPKLDEEWDDKAVESLFELLLKWKRDVNVEMGTSTGDGVVNVVVSPEIGRKIKVIFVSRFVIIATCQLSY